jgi:uncharacterized protein YuzB (UPF0349 family)
LIKRIDICSGNLITGTGNILADLATLFPDIPVYKWSCLGNCHSCYQKPFVLINDLEILTADSPAELLDAISKRIDDCLNKLYEHP